MKRMWHFALALALASLPVSVVTLQRRSLKEMARENGGKALISSEVELPAAPLPQLVGETDFIVEATILSKRGVLSADETRVLTEYTILPLKVLKDKVGVATRPTPGPGAELVVRQPGGQMVVDGLELEYLTNLFPLDGLQVGRTYVMFLYRDTREGGFAFVRGPFGVFLLDGKSVFPATKAAAQLRMELVPKKAEELYAEIVKLTRGSGL
jgi:hypothetical protein